MDKTWKEIHDVFIAGGVVSFIDVYNRDNGDVIMQQIAVSKLGYNETANKYYVGITIDGQELVLTADTETGYPTTTAPNPG